MLDDAAWLQAQLDAGGSVRSIAKTLNADRHTVRIAIVRHDLDRFPAHLVERYHRAVKLEAEARRRQARAVDELLAQGRTIAEVATVLGITPSVVRRLRN